MVADVNSTANEPMAPLKVMVSDIRDQYADALRVLLEPHGFTIQRISSGADAIWLAEHREVDAAVLDNELPDMPGVRVLRAIRSLDLLMPVIIVARTGAAAEQEHLLRSALDFQAFSVLAQPVDLEVLLGQMARLFDRFLTTLDRSETVAFNGPRTDESGEPRPPAEPTRPPGPDLPDPSAQESADAISRVRRLLRLRWRR